jgi:hypothetical protein
MNRNIPVMLPYSKERNPRRDNLDVHSAAPFISGVVEFLNQSPTAWHAVDQVSSRLERAGFVRLDERAAWTLEAGADLFCGSLRWRIDCVEAAS